MREPVPATRVTDSDAVLALRQPGAFSINESGSHIFCECPCGCGSHMHLPLCTGTKVDRAWLWDGRRDAPTLNPSIRDLGGCKFHGYLTAGVWTFEADSGA